MGYQIECQNCRGQGWADNIVDLIQFHTEPAGWIRCPECGGTRAGVRRSSALQEPGMTWTRWIRGVIRIATDFPTYSPYLLLTSEDLVGPVTGIHFGYYKDLRPQGGKLKHGHGPGGPPVFTPTELQAAIARLVECGVLGR